MIPTPSKRITRRPVRHTVRAEVPEGTADITYRTSGSTGWDSELALWELIVSSRLDHGEFSSLEAPEVHAAAVDVEDTLAGRGMQLDPPDGRGPTYPAPMLERPHWREDPALEPHLERYPVVLRLLESERGVDAVYRWAGVRQREADAYALSMLGLTDEAVAEQLKIALPTVTEFVGRVKWRLDAALQHLDQLREAASRGEIAS